jgi:23S rRNA pseudouridine1911/1915/1917 synthase
MMNRKIQFHYTSSNPGRLDRVLHQHLPLYSRRYLRKLILQGSVYVQRKRVHKQSFEIAASEKVTIIVFPYNGAEIDRLTSTVDWASRVLYRDDHLVAINKPCGIPTAPTRESAIHNVYHYARQQQRNC